VVLQGRARAEVRLPKLWGEGMLLQHGVPLTLRGSAAEGEEVCLRFRGRELRATAHDGSFELRLPPLEPGGPWPLEVEGHNPLRFEQVWVGDLWLCGGQSNMWHPLHGSLEAAAAAEELSELRLYNVVPSGWSSGWSSAGAPGTENFSAVGYWFGRALNAHVGIPVGLVHASVGPSAAEQWLPAADLAPLASCAPFEEFHATQLADWEKNEGNDPWTGQRVERPAVAGEHYERMIRPLQDSTMRGVIWYQGEANMGRSQHYAELMAALIKSWRRDWRQPDLPFYYVQLARIGPRIEGDQPVLDFRARVSLLREAQLEQLALPHTGMVVAFDVSNGDMHPPMKRPVGERLARIARARLYGESLLDSGPIFRSSERTDDELVLEFDHAGEGLATSDGEPLRGLFAVEKDVCRPLRARMDGSRLVIAAADVPGSANVVYAWSYHPVGNLVNSAGLPASPFRLRRDPVLVREPDNE